MDATDGLDFFWPTLTPQDVPPPVQIFRSFVTSLENTGKRVQHEALGSKMARARIKAASEIVGGEKALKKRPVFSAVQCPIAPLQFETDSIEAAMEFERAKIPRIYFPVAWWPTYVLGQTRVTDFQARLANGALSITSVGKERRIAKPLSCSNPSIFNHLFVFTPQR